MKRPKLLVFLLMTSLIISATACTQVAPPDSSFSESDNDESLVHSVTRSQEMFSDDALGLQPGANAPSIFQEGKRLVVLTDRAGKTLDWLLSLVSREWNDSVTVVGKESLDIDAGVGWDIIEDPDLITEMKTNIFPAMYIVENGIVSYRAMPTMPVFAKGIIDGLRGAYENSTTYAQTGVKLPQVNLEEKDGSLWSNNIRRNTVFIMVDTSCFVCAPAVEWAATLNNLDADVFLVVTASGKHRYNNMLYLQQEHPDLVPGEFEPPGEAEEIALADYISIFGRPGNVLIDRQESVYSQWGVISWPSVIITDKDGLVVEKMVLSLGSGRIDGTRFAYPTETVEGVLARLPR